MDFVTNEQGSAAGGVPIGSYQAPEAQPAPAPAPGKLIIGNEVEEKFPKENFRVNREMRNEILVYDGRPVFDEILNESGIEMQGKLCQNLDFKVFRARF